MPVTASTLSAPRVAATSYPKGRKIAKNKSHLKFSISLEISISLEQRNLDLRNAPPKIGVWCVDHLKVGKIEWGVFGKGGFK